MDTQELASSVDDQKCIDGSPAPYHICQYMGEDVIKAVMLRVRDEYAVEYMNWLINNKTGELSTQNHWLAIHELCISHPTISKYTGDWADILERYILSSTNSNNYKFAMAVICQYQISTMSDEWVKELVGYEINTTKDTLDILRQHPSRDTLLSLLESQICRIFQNSIPEIKYLINYTYMSSPAYTEPILQENWVDDTKSKILEMLRNPDPEAREYEWYMLCETYCLTDAIYRVLADMILKK
jgi:hypothetical protein